MFPPDGLCHYLFYTHVFVALVDGKHYVRQRKVRASFDAFKKALKIYSKTEGGLSFDIKATNSSEFRKARDDLKGLELNRILHYGTLNVIHYVDRLDGLITRALDLSQAFKELQGKDKKRRTVVAISAVNYNSTGAWDALKNAIKKATEKNIDTVIAISSINSWLAEMKDCRSVPPNIIDAISGYPSLAQNMELVNRANEAVYGSQDVVVGLSLEMGTMMYTYNGPQTDPLSSYAYKQCKTGTLMPLDLACASKNRRKVGDYNAAFGEGTKEVVLFFDDSATLQEKIQSVKNTQLRHQFAWLYFDVDMTDFRNQCGFQNPFQLIQTLRSEFDIQDNPEDT